MGELITLECTYRGRRYSVREDGEVFRFRKEDGIKRKNDEVWTKGKFDTNTGYMLFGGERVHRIVCTAFHGEPVGERNIVDHIDTNRRNNRPENLRWVTRLENTLLNPITRAKIELLCGSVESYLKNPSLLYGHESDNKNFSWMRSVSKEEAQCSLERWLEWSKKPIEERKPKGDGVGEWIFQKSGSNMVESHGIRTNIPRLADEIAKQSKINSAIREFYYELLRLQLIGGGSKICECRVIDHSDECLFRSALFTYSIGENVIDKYKESLKTGAVFFISRYYITEVAEVIDYKDTLRVLCRRIGGQIAGWYIFDIWAVGSVLYHRRVTVFGKNKEKEAKQAMAVKPFSSASFDYCYSNEVFQDKRGYHIRQSRHLYNSP